MFTLLLNSTVASSESELISYFFYLIFFLLCNRLILFCVFIILIDDDYDLRRNSCSAESAVSRWEFLYFGEPDPVRHLPGVHLLLAQCPLTSPSTTRAPA